MSEYTCCGVLERLQDGYSLPFERPLRLTLDLHDIVADQWAVKLITLTKSGRISKRRDKPGLVFLNYCPFCGKCIREAVEPKEKAEK